MKFLIVVALLAASAAAYETVYDSKRDGLDHPYVVYDSKRDGQGSPKQFTYSNDPSFETIYDSKRDGLNHPFVVSDSRRDRAMGASNNMHTGQKRPLYRQQQQQQVQQPMYRQQQQQVQQPMYQQQQQQQYTRGMNVMPQMQTAPVRQQSQQFGGRSQDFSNYEVIYDSKRDGLNHPYVIYDSKRDGQNSPLRSLYDNDPSLTTIFDSKVDGWNHPWVLYDSKRDGPNRRF